MSKTLPWYKRCPADWRLGTRSCGMSMEMRGFYSECLDAMWDLQSQLPKDPKTVAMLLGTNARLVRSLMAKLIDLGKMIETATGYYNPRMMAAIMAVEHIDKEGEFEPKVIGHKQDIKADPKTIQPQVSLKSASSQPPFDLHSTSKIQKNPMISTRDLEIELDIERKPPKSPKGDVPKSGSIFWQQQLNPEALSGVSVVDGELMLVNGTRQFWLSEFDDDEKSLRLALIEIAASLNASSRTPIASQVNRKLSQICQTKLSRRNNYAATVAKNAAKPRKLSRFNA